MTTLERIMTEETTETTENGWTWNDGVDLTESAREYLHFRETVANMRTAQKAFFKQRTADHLHAAKVWEGEVDALIVGRKEETETP